MPFFSLYVSDVPFEFILSHFFPKDDFSYSCNIGEGGIALAEAVHGSAPDIAGKVCIHIEYHVR